METSRADGPDPVPGRPIIDLEALLGDNDAQLVYEGLYRLREGKVEALGVIQAEGLHRNGRPFDARDFGIPQIDRPAGPARRRARRVVDDNHLGRLTTTILAG